MSKAKTLSNEQLGHLMRCVKFGPFMLGDPLTYEYESNHIFPANTATRAREFLEEMQGEDLNLFRQLGAAAEYDDERVFETKSTFELFGVDGWQATFATHEGYVYKYALTLLGDVEFVSRVYLRLIPFIANDLGLGRPKKKLLRANFHTWNTPYSLIRCNKVTQGQISQVNLIVSSTVGDVLEFIMASQS